MSDIPTDENQGSTGQGEVPSTPPAERKVQKDESVDKETKADHASDNADTNTKPWRIKQTLAEAWDFIKTPDFTNPAIAIATIVIAVATVLTYLEVHSGSTQTDRIIAADERIAKAMEDSVAKSQSALDASIEASRNDQRAWFGIKEITLANPLAPGKPVQISIMGLNTGRTPALDLYATEVRVGPSETDRSRDFVIHMPDREVVAPNNTDVFYATVTYSDDSIRAIMAETIRIYVRGELKYRDVFGRSHTTMFCAYYPTNGPLSAVGHFFNCKTGNSMN